MNSNLLVPDLCTRGFHIIDLFLTPEQAQTLKHLAEERYEQGLFQRAKIGLKTKLHKNDAIRTDDILWLENEHNPVLHMFLEKIQQLISLLNHALFLSISEFEVHFAYYQPGSFYKKHVDQFIQQKNRKISFVYYLNKDWKDTYGGALVLYDKEGQVLQQVMPLENRFICFNSELPHEVLVTHQYRYSITGWLKTRA
jgi:SM-20-related protein